ncbi:2822_t:CDS:2 [Diversispora eburnea]|uniref:2822_t:CDS:1 n=1 Tax=Diversispora eburnea TaxID=1213867 RepID=A0A9N8UZY3_9GLOM|nr:2822_t:CDS:2 [Diversispora eburnea]
MLLRIADNISNKLRRLFSAITSEQGSRIIPEQGNRNTSEQGSKNISEQGSKNTSKQENSGNSSELNSGNAFGESNIPGSNTMDQDVDGINIVYDNNIHVYYNNNRHLSNKNQNREEPPVQDWRMRERLKTVSGALVLCLNIGVDPPDVVKPSPCAKLECWVDPFSVPPPKALDAIGKNLQAQYEQLSARTRYKQYLDPSVDEMKKFCTNLRKGAREERVLFHYNGHGVPKPTASGEIWCFNKHFTQYIPVSLGDLQSWLGSPCIYVYDCSAAGNILESFKRFVEQRYLDPSRPDSSAPSNTPLNIQLAACGPNETLPTHPHLPADLFTSCLTSPIEIALRWFVLQNPLPSYLTVDMVMKLPGRLQDRRTPLGELNWIFTAITDTIAWNVLPRDLFKQLFRQDLMVAALFRNFLLAERIMRRYQCNPMSHPQLPPTHDHPMWDSWDLAVDMCLAQLPSLLNAESGGPEVEYKHSSFFDEQLTAFQVWLSKGSVSQKPPEQLPIVLQVLLSQVHRSRALGLLSKYLDLGPRAVSLALSIGIFPYVLKLLQSPAQDLKPPLVFIWARILAVDRSCQQDLLKDSGYVYFVNIIAPNSILNIPNETEHRAMCAFILAILCTNYNLGQIACKKVQVLQACLARLNNVDPLLRQWSCLCIGQYWKNHADAKSEGIEHQAHIKLFGLLNDPVPEVRAASLYALGTFIGDLERTEQIVNIEHNIAIYTLDSNNDASPIVRRELVIALSNIVSAYLDNFIKVAHEELLDIYKRILRQRPRESRPSTVYTCVWKALQNMCTDPDAEVSQPAMTVVDAINDQLLESSHSETVAITLRQVLQDQNSPEIEASRTLINRSTSLEEVLPLKSKFFDWSSESEQLGSIDDNERTWRRKRNSNIIKSTLPLKEVAGSSRWNKQVGLLNNETEPTKLLFHPFEPHLIVANDKDLISVWNWKDHFRTHTFSNGNPTGSKITTLNFINEGEASMLLAGSSDGIVRIYRNYSSPTTSELMTSWRALPEILPNNPRCGLVAEWQQSRGTLLVGGDVRSIRIWDATREFTMRCSITHITSDSGDIIVAGFADGAIRMYDRRIQPRDSMIATSKEHRNIITNVVWQKGASRELVSGSKSGEIKIWDIRQNRSKYTITNEATVSEMNAMDLHHGADIVAGVYSNQLIKVWNTASGVNLSSTRYNAGFLGWGAQVNSVALANHHMVMAVGATDNYLSIYGISH